MSNDMNIDCKTVPNPPLDNTAEKQKNKDEISEYSERFEHLVIRAIRSEQFLLLLGLTAIAIDPLFFYIPEMKNNTSCLGLDKKLRIAAVTLRTCVDIFHDISWWCKSCKDRSPSRWELVDKKSISFVGRIKLLLKWIKSCKVTSHEGRPSLPARAIAVLGILPIPQVAVFAVGLHSHLKAWLKCAVLAQLVPRIFRTYPTYLVVTTASDQYKWIGAAFNLVFYVFASHVLGGFWYLRSIERKMDCWEKACGGNSACNESSLYCGDNNSINNGLIYDVCAAQPTSNATTPYNYGTYKDAIESNIIGTTNFINKLTQSFWWGLHNLSSMAQDLESSDYIWDTVFAIFICIIGLVLFALLIGNLQVYIQSKMPTTLEKIKEKRKELKLWKPFYELPKDLRREVSMCRKHKWREASEVNLETLLADTPRNLKIEIRRHLCKNLFSMVGFYVCKFQFIQEFMVSLTNLVIFIELEEFEKLTEDIIVIETNLMVYMKVEGFEKLPEKVRKNLRDKAKARVFPEKTTIIEEGNPIYEMLHIVEGKVLTYKKDVKGTSEAKHLVKKECFGEEVLETALISSTPTLAFATKTFQSVTKVEAFTLSFDDIVAAFSKYGWHFSSYKVKWAVSVIEDHVVQRKNRARKNQDKSPEGKDQNLLLREKVSKMMKGDTNHTSIV